MCNSPVEFSGLVRNQPGRRGKTKIIPAKAMRPRALEACAG
jgi:hypothetical protein